MDNFTAASVPGLRVCARHVAYAAPSACACGAPLCGACSRHKPHQACPTCRTDAGEAPATPNFTWAALLFVDGVVGNFGVLFRRVLPACLALLALGIAIGFGTFALLGNGRAPTVELVGAALAGAAFLGWLLQPGLALPVARPARGLRWRAAVASLGVTLASLFGCLLIGGAVAVGSEVNVWLGVVLGIVVALVGTLVVAVIAPFALALIGVFAYRGELRTLRADRMTALHLFGLHTAAAMIGYLVGVMPLTVVPDFMYDGAGTIALVIGGVMAMVSTFFLQGAFIGAAHRYLEDRAS